MNDTDNPPWISELRAALGVAYVYLRGRSAAQLLADGHDFYVREGDREFIGQYERADVDAALDQARQLGWDGSEQEFWKAATSMSHFTGAMPWHPQRHFELSEAKRWRTQGGTDS